jgi:predicted protein tyrosine phosphatase
MNILFICSRNKWRSATAEAIYKSRQDISVRSAGTEPSARIRINTKLIQWADLIFAMEKEHKQRIIEQFSNDVRQKKILVLNIPDEYQFMDPELIDLIQTIVDPIIESYN